MPVPASLQKGLTLPVICAPMFIVSNPDLVIAQCKSGVIGSFPALNARPKEALDQWLTRIKTELATDPNAAAFAVNQIIPILDTLEMAANAPTTDENYKKGVTMTLDKAAKALDALHVEEIEALGKPFDPNFMNAVQQITAPDGQESGTVITVDQKGYKLGDKIVRHATVVVAE